MNKLTVKPLPYDYNALEPVISKQIMELHHDKHYVNYVNAFNTTLDLNKISSFNYNGVIMHEIFWNNMRLPKENNLPPEGMFEDFNKFKEEFTTAATTVEGSGWAVWWKADNGLAISQLEKHNLLGLNGAKPILVCDVWEHAYYLQYLNNRAEYVKQWWNVVNWEDVEKRLK